MPETPTRPNASSSGDDQSLGAGACERFFELSIDLLAIASLDGRFQKVNASWTRTLGHPEDELLGRPFIDFVHPDDKAATRQETQRLAAGQDTVQFENRYRCRDGTYRWLAWRARSAPDEGLIYGIARDVTERRAAFEEFGRLQQMLQRVVDHVPASIAYLDKDLVYRWVNDAAVRWSGIPLERFLGRSHFEVFPDGNPERNPMARAVRERKTVRAEEVKNWPTPGARALHLDVLAVPILGPNRSVEGVLAFGIDVSDRIEKERLQAREIEGLKEVERIKTDFTSAVSHELRTPLASICGFTEFLEDGIGGPLTAEQQDFVRQIAANGRRLQRLVDDLLDFARLDAGVFELAVRPADLAAKAHEILEGFMPQARAGNVALEASLPEPLPLSMDAQRIGQVVANLLANAIAYTPAGGQVRLAAWRVDGAIRCEVADGGPGITPDDQAKLFKRFSRLDRQKRGTGLGLSISKAIVEAHGGRIGVTSEPGKGATFWFELPLVPDGASQPHAIKGE